MRTVVPSDATRVTTSALWFPSTNVSTSTRFSRAQIIGRAQSVPPIGMSLTAFTTSSRRWRGEMEMGVRPPLQEVKPTAWNRGSTRAVTMAIAALATRGVSPGTPAMAPPSIDPETSSASRCDLPAGSMLWNDR